MRALLFGIVSNQIIAEDVRNLRVGLEDVKAEKEREPDNFILFISPISPVSTYIHNMYLQKDLLSEHLMFP